MCNIFVFPTLSCCIIFLYRPLSVAELKGEFGVDGGSSEELTSAEITDPPEEVKIDPLSDPTNALLSQFSVSFKP